MTGGVERIVKGAIRATLSDPRESVFMARFAMASREASRRRTKAEAEGEYPNMVFVSFPGDEKTSGGCLAAGRGFFHINSHGGAEPCPFSPYSDVNVKNTSLRQALRSPLFTAWREQGVLMEEHSGGCVLFERKESVEAILAESAR